MKAQLQQQLQSQYKIDLVFVSVYENAKKKELGQYSAILNEDAWSITHTNKQLNLAHEKKDCLAG